MSSKTKNYNLHKIDLTDAPPDITVLNPNWDTIDDLFANKADLENGKVPKRQLPDIQTMSTISTALLINGWTLGADGRYYQTIAVSGVKADTEFIMVDCDLTTDDADARIEILTAWAFPSANEVDQGDGTLTFYSYGIPPVSIPIFVGVTL